MAGILPTSSSTLHERETWLDGLRGAAVVWMTAYHFAFDLNYFGWIHQDFYRSPVWTIQRTCILSLFLLCAGLGQSAALRYGQNWNQFGRRWLQIVACAALVSLGSSFMFPTSWIYFGVLHGVASMLVLCRLTSGWGQWLWGIGLLWLSIWLANPWLHANFVGMVVFDQRALSWLGLASKRPVTEDFVPLFPWMAVMWWGMAAGQRLTIRATNTPHALVWLGRWSLTWYMLHQPLLIGGLMVFAAIKV
jgi:uncharacterized membrane protein